MAYKTFETDNAEYVLVYANPAQQHIKHVDCLEEAGLKDLDAVVLELMAEPKAEVFEAKSSPLTAQPGASSPYELILNRIHKLYEDGESAPSLLVGDREVGPMEKMIYGMSGSILQAVMMLVMQKGIPRKMSYALFGLLGASALPALSKLYLKSKKGEVSAPVDEVVAAANLLPPTPAGELRYSLLAAKLEEYVVPELLAPRVKAKGEERKPRVAIVYSVNGASIKQNLTSKKRRDAVLGLYSKLNWFGLHQPSLDSVVELTAVPAADGSWSAKDYRTGVVLPPDAAGAAQDEQDDFTILPPDEEDEEPLRIQEPAEQPKGREDNGDGSDLF